MRPTYLYTRQVDILALTKHLLVQAAALQFLVIQDLKDLNAEPTISHQDEAAWLHTLAQLVITDTNACLTWTNAKFRLSGTKHSSITNLPGHIGDISIKSWINHEKSRGQPDQGIGFDMC